MKKYPIEYYCKVCGLNRNYDPYEDGGPDYSICSCCACEVGNNDYTEESIYSYRINWIKQNFHWNLEKKGFTKEYPMWFSENEKPKDWNPIEQLKNIGIDFSDDKVLLKYKKDIPNIEEVLNNYLK